VGIPVVRAGETRTFAARSANGVARQKQQATMRLTKEAKSEIFKTHGGEAKNTGSTEGQIALFTARIEHLTAHLKTHKKDHGTESALMDLVGKRKQLLNYLKNHDIERYRAIIGKLGLRK
jgi:small subunit ribosomal protein S15